MKKLKAENYLLIMGVLIIISYIFMSPYIDKAILKILFTLSICIVEFYVIKYQIRVLYVHKKDIQLRCKTCPENVFYYYDDSENEGYNKKIIIRSRFERKRQAIRIFQYSLTDYPIYVAHIIWTLKDDKEKIYVNNSSFKSIEELAVCCAEIITEKKPILLKYEISEHTTKSIIIDKKVIELVFDVGKQAYVEKILCNDLGLKRYCI